MANQRQPGEPQRLMRYYQFSIGATGALILAFGIWGYVAASVHPFAVGMAIRVGTMLAVICLALPQLIGLRHRLPSIALGFGLVVMFLIAARPRIGNILVGVLAIALTANAALAWLADLTRNK